MNCPLCHRDAATGEHGFRVCRTRLAAPDLSGKRFGKWTLLLLLTDGRREYRARCDCGRLAVVLESNVVRGLSTQCRRCAHEAMRTWVPGTVHGGNVILAVQGDAFRVRCVKCGSVRTLQSKKSLRASGCRACDARTHGKKIRRLYTAQGETHHLAEWARRLGVCRQSLDLRLKAGWPIERALTTPGTGSRAA